MTAKPTAFLSNEPHNDIERENRMSKKRGQGEGTIFEESPGRWVASLTVGYEVRDGKRRRIRKKFVRTTRQEVQQALNDALHKQHRGVNVAPTKRTMGDFLAVWLEHTVKPNVRPKTYRSYEQMVRNHLSKTIPAGGWKEKKLDNVPGLAATKLKDLSVERLEQYFNAKLAAGNSPALVRYLRTVLRIALNEALRRDAVEKNVAELVRPPSVPKPQIRPFTPDEARRLLMAVQGHRLESLFTVALAIGLRHGEALGLQWDDIDNARGTLRVHHALQRVDGKLVRVEPKSAESRRVVPLPPFCIEALKAHRERQQLERAIAGETWRETGYVFTSTIGTPLSDRNVLREFHKLLNAAKLGQRRFHDLRHACVSLLAAQGVDTKEIAKIVGHSDVRLTRNVYQHGTEEAKRAGLSKVGDFLVAPQVAPSPAEGSSEKPLTN
jgi:integrase